MKFSPDIWAAAYTERGKKPEVWDWDPNLVKYPELAKCMHRYWWAGDRDSVSKLRYSIVGGVEEIFDEVGNGVEIDFSNEWIEFPTGEGGDCPPGASMLVFLDFEKTGVVGIGGIMGHRSDNSDGMWQIYDESSNRFHFYYQGSTGSQIDLILGGFGTTPNGRLRLVLHTYWDGTNRMVEGYVNGELVGTNFSTADMTAGTAHTLNLGVLAPFVPTNGTNGIYYSAGVAVCQETGKFPISVEAFAKDFSDDPYVLSRPDLGKLMGSEFQYPPVRNPIPRNGDYDPATWAAAFTGGKEKPRNWPWRADLLECETLGEGLQALLTFEGSVQYDITGSRWSQNVPFASSRPLLILDEEGFAADLDYNDAIGLAYDANQWFGANRDANDPRPITIYIRYKADSPNSGGDNWLFNNNFPATGPNFGVRWKSLGGGQACLQMYNQGSAYRDSPAFDTDGEYHDYHWVWRDTFYGNTCLFYVDGEYIGSVDTGSSAFSGQGMYPALGTLSGALESFQPEGDINMFAAWGRELSAREIKASSSFGIIRPDLMKLVSRQSADLVKPYGVQTEVDPDTLAAAYTPPIKKPEMWDFDPALCRNPILEGALFSTPLFETSKPWSPQLGHTNTQDYFGSVREGTESVTECGRGYDPKGINDAVCFWTGIPKEIKGVIDNPEGFSLIIVCDVSDNHSYAVSIGQNNNGVWPQFIPFTNYQIRWRVRNGGIEDRVDSGQVFIPGEPIVFVGTHKTLVEHHMYVGNHKTKEVKADIEISSYSDMSGNGYLEDNLLLGNLHYNTSGNAYDGSIYWVGLVPGLVTQEQFLEILDDPFGPITPDLAKVYPQARAPGEFEEVEPEPPGFTYDLTGNPVSSGEPTVSTPSLGQAYNLSGSDVDSGVPTVGNPVITQEHILTGDNALSGVPTVEDGDLTQTHILSAVLVDAGTPSAGQPSISQDHIFSASEVATGTPTVSNPALAQDGILSGEPAETEEPTVGQGVLTQKHLLGGSDINSGVPEVGSPTLTFVHVLAGDNVDSGVPDLEQPVFVQDHQLSGSPVAAGTPETGSTGIGHTYVLDGEEAAAEAPTVESPVMTFSHSLTAGDIATGLPTTSSPGLTTYVPPDPLFDTVMKMSAKRTLTVKMVGRRVLTLKFNGKI